MKQTTKRGFTIVELVIVIAVIAILAAVLIPTFSNIVKKANASADTQLVRNLNTALSTDKATNGEHKTMQSAMDAAAAAGYDIDKINASATDNEILWDSVADCFCYLDGDTGNISYTPDVTGDTADKTKTYLFWQIADEMPETAKYSVYAGKDWTATTVTANGVGFDAGNATGIVTINYSATDDRAVTIRTNSDATTLNVDAKNGTVYHYDVCGIVNTLTANASYHEYGTVNFIENSYGHVVLESTAVVKTVLLSKSSDMTNHPATLENKGGKLENKYSTTNEVAEKNNADSKNVTLELATAADDLNDVLTYGTVTEADITAATDAKKDDAAGEAITANLSAEKNAEGNQKYVVRVGTDAYETFEEAIEAADEKAVTITLLADVDLTNYTANGLYAEYEVDLTNDTLNLNGHKIISKNHAVEFEGDNVVIENGTFEVAENGSYALCLDESTATLNNISTIGGINVHTSTVEIYNGSCNEAKGTNYYALWADINGTIIVYSGKFSSPSTTGGCVLNARANDDDSTITIKGGEFEALGTANMFSSSANIIVEGGTFNKEVPSANYSYPYAVKNNNDGTWTVYNSAKYKVTYSAEEYVSIANKTNLDAAIASNPSNVYLDPHGVNSGLTSEKIIYTSTEIACYNCTPAQVYNAYNGMWTAAACPNMWFTKTMAEHVEYFSTEAEADTCVGNHSGAVKTAVN